MLPGGGCAMKRIVLSLVTTLALLFSVQSAKADWIVFVASSGWAYWEFDPCLGDGEFDTPPRPPLPPLPPGHNYFLRYTDDIWLVSILD
jgi:hypothetical protein